MAPLIIGRPDQKGSTGRNNPSRTFKHSLDKHLHAQRHLVERSFTGGKSPKCEHSSS